MTVAELIQKLQYCGQPDARVVMVTDCDDVCDDVGSIDAAGIRPGRGLNEGRWLECYEGEPSTEFAILLR